MVENAFTAASSRNLPLYYFVAVAVVSLGVPLAVALVARLAMRRRAAPDFPDAVSMIAGGTFFLWFLDEAIVLATARAIAPVLVILTLLVVIVAGGLGAVAVLRRVSRPRHTIMTFLLAIAAFYLWMVGGRYLTKLGGGVYFSSAGLVLNFALLGGLFGVLVVIGRLRVGQGVRARALAGGCVLVAAAGTLASWRAQSESELPIPAGTAAASGTGAHVVLITVDTLRADRVSTHGYARPTGRHLDRLAKTSLVFNRAVSPSTWTFPGHVAILTGKLPRRLGLGADGHDPNTDPDGPRMRVAGGVETLAEILSRAGYDTAAFVANAAYLTRFWGFDQGFALYDDRAFRGMGYEPGVNAIWKLSPLVFDWLTKPYRPAEVVNETVFRWLQSRGTAPFFLFVNYMEPHEPYAPPSPYDRRFDGRDLFLRSPARAILAGTRTLSAEERRHFDALYDGEVAYADAAIGSLLERLEDLGLYDDSLIIVTSDHGEFLGEHDLFGHGYGPYDPIHRVPLIIKLPGARHGRVVDEWVQTTDVFPTVLRELSIPVPDGIDGEVLPDIDHPVVIEQPPNSILSQYGERFLVSYRGIYDGDWKLIAFTDGSSELYNLDVDPLETENVVSEHPEIAARLMRALTDFLDSVPRDAAGVEPAVVDEDALDQLRALGYAEP